MRMQQIAGFASCCAECRADDPTSGLGWIEAVAAIGSAIIGAAGQIYGAQQSRRTAERLQQREHEFQLSLQERAAAAMNLGGGTASLPLLVGGAAVLGFGVFLVARK